MAPLSVLSVAVALLAVLTEVGSSSSELRRKLTKVRKTDRTRTAEKPKHLVHFLLNQLFFMMTLHSPLCNLK